MIACKNCGKSIEMGKTLPWVHLPDPKDKERFRNLFCGLDKPGMKAEPPAKKA